MRDDLMGGLLATAVVAPAMIVCCGGGGVLLVGLTGAVAGWLSGPGGVAALMGATAAALVWRSLCRHRKGGGCNDAPLPGYASDLGSMV